MSIDVKDSTSKAYPPPYPGQNGNGGKTNLSAEETFKETRKKFTVVGGSIAGVSGIGILLGALKYGKTFPAKCLEVIGDGFGSIAAVLTPASIIGNEVKNYYSLKEGKNGSNGKGKEENHIFDDWREGLYRTCSLGFTPFIFEPFINPEKFGKSIFHKIATVANIPNLLFSGYAWGAGNFQALLAWSLRKKEQIQARNVRGSESAEVHNKRAEEYNRLYQGCKRMAVIGSIANPTLQGLRQWADSMNFMFGDMSAGEFFERPCLGISRLVSLGVGLPELFAKGVDSVVRVCKERENLKPALPQFAGKGIDNFANWLEPRVSDTNHPLSSIRHYAEILFHTLSPLSMFALFAPLLDEPYQNEEIQARGGLPAFLDKVIGRYGKILMVVFNGLYVTLGRLPQTFIECAYFGKKLVTGKKATVEEMEAYKKKICNSGVVTSISDVAKNCINYLVPDWYVKDSDGSLTYNYENENEHGYLTYNQIQAKYSFEQAQEYFKETFTKDKEDVIVRYCLDYVVRDAKQGKHDLSSGDLADIEKLIRDKVNYKINPELKLKRKVKLPFIGSEFLATYIFKLFDLKTMFESIDFKSSHHDMTTAYDNLERKISFDEQEGNIVFAKCTVSGLRNTLNRAADVWHNMAA